MNVLLQNVFANINRILSDAAKLIENGHYASSHVRAVAARLDKTWKDFAGCLDERTTVLALSVLFHQKAEQYGANVEQWSQVPFCSLFFLAKSKERSFNSCGTKNCDLFPQQTCDPSSSSNSPGDIPALESSIHQHQSLYESMCQAYTEVHSTSKKLLYQLDHLVQLSSQTGGGDADRKHVSVFHLGRSPTIIAILLGFLLSTVKLIQRFTCCYCCVERFLDLISSFFFLFLSLFVFFFPCSSSVLGVPTRERLVWPWGGLWSSVHHV